MIKNVTLLFFLFFLIGNTYGQSPACFDTDHIKNTLEGNWVGEFVQNSCGIHEILAMSVEITTIRDSVVQGLFIWENQEDQRIVKTRLEGFFRHDSLDLYETSLVTGEGLVLNGVYEIPARSCNRLEGIWRVDALQVECEDPQTLTEGGRFILHKLQPGVASAPGVKIIAPLVVPAEYLTFHVQRKDSKRGTLQLYRNGKVLLENIQSQRPHKLIIPLDSANQVFSLKAKELPLSQKAEIKLELYSQGQKLTEFDLKGQGNSWEGIRIRKP